MRALFTFILWAVLLPAYGYSQQSPREHADSLWKVYLQSEEKGIITKNPSLKDIVNAYEEAIDINLEENDYNEMAGCYCQLSEVYHHANDIVAAIEASISAYQNDAISEKGEFFDQVLFHLTKYDSNNDWVEFKDSLQKHNPKLYNRWKKYMARAREEERLKLIAMGEDGMGSDDGLQSVTYEWNVEDFKARRGQAKADLIFPFIVGALLLLYVAYYIFVINRNLRKEDHDPVQIKSKLVSYTTVWSVFSGLSILAILPTAMSLGGPDVSELTFALVLLGQLGFPVLSLVGLIIGWSLYKKGEYNAVVPVAMMPTIAIALFIAGFTLG